jgi:hypothetical protein
MALSAQFSLLHSDLNDFLCGFRGKSPANPALAWPDQRTLLGFA